MMSYLELLSLEAARDKLEDASLVACLLSKGATIMSSSAQSSNTSPCEFAKIALSKALLSFLTACCHKNDAEGSSTGATFCEVQSQKFDGNDTFFELSLIHI